MGRTVAVALGGMMDTNRRGTLVAEVPETANGVGNEARFNPTPGKIPVN